jgi:hypothetical protein
LVVRTESGKFRVKYGPLADASTGVITVHGPGMVLPPDTDMTQEELSRWHFELVNETGYYYSIENAPVTDAVVEATRTYEDEIPRGSVRAELFWAQINAGDRTLAVRVTNGWSRQIPKFSLSTDCHYDAPQPVEVGAVQGQWLGGSESMFHPIGFKTGGNFWPGLTLEFALDPMVMGPLRSRVAALSTESYWIALRTAGHEFDRIPGERVGAFVEGEG